MGLKLARRYCTLDSIPLFAFIFKPFASLFPQVFQYTGIWLLTCFLLQAWFGWKLIGLITKEPVIRVLGSGLFVFSLPMLFRLSGHFSLVGHFVILAAIYLSFRPLRKAGLMAWAVLLVVAAMVHAYLLVMVAAFWVTDLFRGGLEHKRIPLHLWSEFGAVLIIVGLACWQVGYFSVGSSAAGDGFGHYRMNLLSIFDPNGWSFVLNDIPGGPGEYEGFNYLGLGVIFLLLFGVPAIVSGEIGLLHATRRHAILLLPLASLALFSLSNQVGIGQFEFTVSLPEPLTGLAAIFRSSGRMFWPVFYFILLLSIFIVVRGNNRRGAILLLTIALVAQVLDTRAKWEQLRAEFMVSPAAQWPTSMKAVFWEEAAQRYKECGLHHHATRQGCRLGKKSQLMQVTTEWERIRYIWRASIPRDCTWLSHERRISFGREITQMLRCISSIRQRSPSLWKHSISERMPYCSSMAFMSSHQDG